MDAPNSSPEAADAAETSPGPVSDSPAATRPSSASTNASTEITAPRPRQIRSGAIAAACAIAVVLGITAVPSGGGKSTGAAYAPIATRTLEALPTTDGTAAMDLGAELGAYAIPGTPSWKEYDGGAVTAAVWFRSDAIADAVFAGEIRMSKPFDGGVSASFDEGGGYAKIEGELFGRGAFDGVMLRIENARGSKVHRGTWSDGEITVDDAVFARFDWTSEGESDRGNTVPSSGTGTIAFALRGTGEL